jgi:hypothetical protein
MEFSSMEKAVPSHSMGDRRNSVEARWAAKY